MTATFRRNVQLVFTMALTLVTWGYSVLSKRRDPVNPWRSVVFQRNGILISATVMRDLFHPNGRNWLRWVLAVLWTGIWFILRLRNIMGIFLALLTDFRSRLWLTPNGRANFVKLLVQVVSLLRVFYGTRKIVSTIICPSHLSLN
jgi:hypothetical protein